MLQFLPAFILIFGARFALGNEDTNGAVACESAVCSQIGLDIMKDNGNAADAMVATQLCIGTIAMYSSGIGGGGFVLVRSKEGIYDFIDFRETAPAAAYERMFSRQNLTLSVRGGLAAGVPGELRGLKYLHDTYGKKPWKDLFTPSIKLAREGFKVSQDLYNDIVVATDGTYEGIGYDNDFFTEDVSWAMDFAPNGTRVGLGDTMTRKRFADTLENIAEQGPDAFYTGAIANATIVAIQQANGTMTLSDLKNYAIVNRPITNFTYHGFKIYSGTAPSSGAVLASIMKIIEGYDMRTPAQLNFSTHYLDEAMKFAYGQRTLLGDPAFLPNLTEYQLNMYSESTAEEFRSKIEADAVLETKDYEPPGDDFDVPDHGTTAVVTADKSGLSIALTSTVNFLFGNTMMVPEIGVILNNQMNDFSVFNTSNAFGVEDSPANYIAPFKRPLSSIAPVIVEFPNGKVYVVHACAGGSRITTEISQHLWHVLDQNLTSAAALLSPRMYDQLYPPEVSLEWVEPDHHMVGYNNQTAAFLKSIGANVTYVGFQSAGQAIRRLFNGTFEAAAEPRQLASGGYAY
ncbi:gamma-glutamyltranspeptidase [Hyaloscypha variabilis F]|uniref:Glutathione hydrolase n=1 Tax=Hyaloscypha variabilis (strain UAMH 11265 / GT02V1 / F) TaxID=1149755 RepID=A0A2J6QV65_HYAVF|nr:gamma-glutamyltranspeptidase [Hyaloscypha variabilis F]